MQGNEELAIRKRVLEIDGVKETEREMKRDEEKISSVRTYPTLTQPPAPRFREPHTDDIDRQISGPGYIAHSIQADTFC
jgi:hypothetical protein